MRDMMQTKLDISVSVLLARLGGNDVPHPLNKRGIFCYGCNDAEELVDSFLTSWPFDGF